MAGGKITPYRCQLSRYRVIYPALGVRLTTCSDVTRSSLVTPSLLQSSVQAKLGIRSSLALNLGTIGLKVTGGLLARTGSLNGHISKQPRSTLPDSVISR
ncbi:hypothetical protein J6590_081507 [Homalodisca vitripennis]|nr:hypothetical protein J6590_081507 [Homalodisca vitripennis]